MEKRFYFEFLLLISISKFVTSSYSDFDPSSNLEYSVPENDFENTVWKDNHEGKGCFLNRLICKCRKYSLVFKLWEKSA